MILLHSFYLHKKTWKVVRICNDVAALSLIFESLCCLDCIWHTCALKEQVVMFAGIANSWFGLVIQLCDNYLTFARYAIVATGGVSRLHVIGAALWVFFTLCMSWWEFYSILPFFYNMNSPVWSGLTFDGNYLNVSGYLMYDCFYLSLLIRFLSNAKKVVSASSDKYTNFAIRAMGHTTMSIIGVCLYCFDFPKGMIEQNMFITIGIHFFLNWSNSHRVCFRKKTKLLHVRPKETTKSKQSQRGTSKKITIVPSSESPTT